MFTTEKTVLHNIVPLEEALNKPASVTAPVPVPAANEAVYVRTAPEIPVLVRATLPSWLPRAVSPAAAEVEPLLALFLIKSSLPIPILLML